MSKRSDILLLTDMLEAIEKIQQYSSGYSKDEFEKDSKTFDAVIRNLEILGEAANHISEELKNNHPEINWFQIRGLRNRIVHDYVGIDYDIIWEVISARLVPIQTVLIEIIKNM